MAMTMTTLTAIHSIHPVSTVGGGEGQTARTPLLPIFCQLLFAKPLAVIRALNSKFMFQICSFIRLSSPLFASLRDQLSRQFRTSQMQL